MWCLLNPQRKSCGNGDGMQIIGLSVHFVKCKTSLLPGGMTANRCSGVNGQVTVNHSSIVKKMSITKIFVNSCFISQKEKKKIHQNPRQFIKDLWLLSVVM